MKEVIITFINGKTAICRDQKLINNIENFKNNIGLLTMIFKMSKIKEFAYVDKIHNENGKSYYFKRELITTLPDHGFELFNVQNKITKGNKELIKKGLLEVINKNTNYL